jgi:protein-disulfide isomerase
VRKVVFVILLILPILPTVSLALPPAQAMLTDRSLGNASAKVAIVEYSSLTCPHCADFHRDVLPQIKQEYIDKGLVRYVARDFPLDRVAMAAAMTARCVPPDRYFGFLDMLFRDQQAWARSANPLDDLRVRAQLAGLTSAEFDACLANQDLLKGIQTAAAEAQKRDGIESTPTFFIDGKKISGAASYDRFKSVIDEAIGKAR